MEFKKKQIKEIIDSNGDLIGTDAMPKFDANADTAAHGTTDQNAKIGQQPFRYDMLGRFGFTLMPFMEGVEENDGQAALLKDLAKLMYDKYMSTIEHYYKNPNKLKSDFRMHSEHDFESQPEHNKKIDFDLAKNIVKVVQKHFEDAFKEPQQIDESFDLTIPFDEKVKEILRDLLRGGKYDKTGILDQRIDQLLKINGVWLERAKQMYSAEEIAKKLIKYEENLNEIGSTSKKSLTFKSNKNELFYITFKFDDNGRLSGVDNKWDVNIPDWFGLEVSENSIIDYFRKRYPEYYLVDTPLTEAKVVEDKMVDKKSEDEMTKKSEDKDVRSSKLEKIAGLINKLEKKDIDKLINLLERK